MAKKVKVKVLTGIASPDWAYAPGDIAEIDPDEAQRWIKAGIAAPLEGKIETATVKPPEKAVREPVETATKEPPETADALPEQKESEWPKHVGGGYYELSNGKKVRGKESALKVQKELDEESGE